MNSIFCLYLTWILFPINVSARPQTGIQLLNLITRDTISVSKTVSRSGVASIRSRDIHTGGYSQANQGRKESMLLRLVQPCKTLCRKYVCFEYDLYLVCVENIQFRACLINVGMVVRCWIDLPIHAVTGHSSN
jgi:hypothetical protein